MEEKRREKEESSKTSNFPDLNPIKREIRYFNSDDGRPLNINQDKIDFVFTENEESTGYVLDVSCYKHMGMCIIILFFAFFINVLRLFY